SIAAAQVFEDQFVRVIRFFECVGEDGEAAVVERAGSRIAFLVSRLRQADDSTIVPRPYIRRDDEGAERVAEVFADKVGIGGGFGGPIRRFPRLQGRRQGGRPRRIPPAVPRLLESWRQGFL